MQLQKQSYALNKLTDQPSDVCTTIWIKAKAWYEHIWKVLGSHFENLLLMKTTTDNYSNADSSRYWGTEPSGEIHLYHTCCVYGSGNTVEGRMEKSQGPEYNEVYCRRQHGWGRKKKLLIKLINFEFFKKIMKKKLYSMALI